MIPVPKQNERSAANSISVPGCSFLRGASALSGSVNYLIILVKFEPFYVHPKKAI